MAIFQRNLAASAGDKLQLVYDTERRDLYVEDGPNKLSVDDALRRGGRGSTELGLLFVDLFKGPPKEGSDAAIQSDVRPEADR
jgi:hypothetical protein